MEENFNGGHENHEERRDYARNEGSTSNYSSEGRKLRPRRKVGSYSNDNHRNTHQSYGQGGERRPYGQSRPRYNEDRPHYGEDRPRYNDERPRYGQDRPRYGESRPRNNEDRPRYGQDRPQRSDNRPRYNEDRPRYSENRPRYGEERPRYNEDRPRYNEDRPRYGQDRPQRPDSRPRYGEDRPRFNKDRKPSFGGQQKAFAKPAPKRQPRKNGPHFTANDEAGINQMISRNPQVNNAYSDNDNVATPIKEEIRLNKFIANSGVCSRREADTLIQAGVVTVNGEVVTELGTKVNVLKDDIRFNGERLKGEEKVYIVMNKPKGFVTSASDPHAEKTVMDLIKGCHVRVFPVGRLDKNTTGILMFTNDGEIAEQLTHPSYNKKKIYQVILDKALEESDKEKILVEGLELSDGVIKADELEYIDAEDHRKLGIEIHSGKNRIVRRIFESLGYTVKALDRVYFAGLTKKGLKKGEWRFLSEGEVNVLRMGAYV
ncbi:MAG: pseudouridine synthase [Bacteroidales bacterium]|nr:pseudouridine synthase [Bacteroidales bacterium]